MPKEALTWSTADSVIGAGEAAYSISQNGLDFENTLQLSMSLLGVYGNAHAFGSMKGKFSKPQSSITRLCKTCFVAGTQVVTDKGLKNIEEIKVGDFVLSKDSKTNKSDYKCVQGLTTTYHAELYIITYKDANGDEYELKVSREHPFWVADKGWVAARELAIADKLVITDDTVVTICAIKTEKAPDGKPFTAYNFEVADYHTYYVIQEGKTNGFFAVLVHNTSICNQQLLKLQGEIQNKANKVGGALNKWMMSSGAANHPEWGRHVKKYQAIMNNVNATSREINRAKMLKGRFLDKRMQIWMSDTYKFQGMTLDKAITGSGRMRPDVFIPNIGGQSVIFDFGGPSKFKTINKYNRLADEVMAIVPDVFK